MRKLCLILTVLYAFGANCSAQSLNIAKNLLEGNSSTFNYGWGDWGEQGDHCNRSFKSTGGPDGTQCVLLTSNYAPNDWNAQLKYNFAAAQGTTYVFRLKAKKLSGNGTIRATMQHNAEPFEQTDFFTAYVTEDWVTYAGEVKANLSNYDVIMINYGSCGEVLIDDIEFGVKTNNIAPSFTTDLKTSYTVGEGGTLNLSVAASGTPDPAYQWYSNTTTNSTVGATPIDGATKASYSVPTATQGTTTYYYCVATNEQGSATSTIAGVTVTAPVHATGVTLDKSSASVKLGKTITLTATVEPEAAVNKNVKWSSNNPSVATVSNGVVTGMTTGTAKITATTVDGSYTASCMVTVTTSLQPLLISDFENIDNISGIIYPNVDNPDKNQHIYIDLIDAPIVGGKCVAITDGSYKNNEYSIINIPDAAKDYSILAFDIYYPGENTDNNHGDMNYKTIPVSLTYKDGQDQDHTVEIAKYMTPVFPAPAWDTKLINFAGKIPAEATSIKVKIGPVNSRRGQLYLDNIRVKENPDDVEDFTQDGDLSDIWWKVDENNTLYIRGNGVIPDYGNKKCPWEDQTQKIEYVVVSEGITGIGNCSVGNSVNNNVDITLHSIPEYFGKDCLQKEINGKLTRTLHLELRDTEKPFIAKSMSENFPTFNTAKYYRDVTSNYSTVCLPFPVAAETVNNADVELFYFTSIKKIGEQYTLAFSKHSGDMEAGQTYLIKNNNNNIEVTLENTNVTKDKFNLTPLVSEKTVENSDPTFSISMTGVFQPSVFGPNLETVDAPKYAYGFRNEKFYMNSGNMSVRPMRGYFYGSQLYSGQQQSGAKKMPKMFNFGIVPGIETHISSPDFIAEDFNIEEVYSPSGMKTESLNKGLNIIRTSTGRVLKVMVK